MEDSQRIVKCGSLLLHTNGGFFKKRWNDKYLVLYDGSKSGIKRLELFDSEIKFKKQNPAKIIPLIDCVRVVTCQLKKTNYTFEVRTNDEFYLLAGHSFQDMNDWVNCLRKVAFGQQLVAAATTTSASSLLAAHAAAGLQTTGGQLNPGGGKSASKLAAKGTDRDPINLRACGSGALPTKVTQQQQLLQKQSSAKMVDVLLEPAGSLFSPQQAGSRLPPAQQVAASDAPGGGPVTAQQAKVAASVAAAKSRQRQPSLLGSCKPQPPMDSPFLNSAPLPGLPLTGASPLTDSQQVDTLTPSVRGQLISAASCFAAKQPICLTTSQQQQQQQATTTTTRSNNNKPDSRLDEEEENMLYCSIEDNPSEHNYRVKVIETELAQRCQLKCYPLVASATVDQQYEQLAKFQHHHHHQQQQQQHSQELLVVTFYQLIIGPQELTLLNDYQQQPSRFQLQQQQQQGLWSWPYQCIRRYGFDKDNCFMFEAGRKCTSGPGQFIVQTPKAYHIYQDVVKFVNELRSLNSSSKPLSSLPSIQETETPRCQQQSGKSVTQISVSWTPIVAKLDSGRPQVSRSVFFDNLNRQLEGGAQQVAAPGDQAKALPLPLPDKPQREQQVGTGSREKYLDSEETDESGYDQGDDSVDSSTRSSSILAKANGEPDGSLQTKTGNDKTPKRCHEDSSSAESCNSSQGIGSPAHSIGKRAGQASGAALTNNNNNSGGDQLARSSGANKVSNQQQHQQQQRQVKSKVALLEQNKSQSISGGTSSKTLNGLQKLLEAEALASGGPDCQIAPAVDDFEASLIRDVYSEISKLHATFAIATSDDVLSSRGSSQDPSSDDGGDTASNPTTTGSVSSSGSSLSSREPTYTNMSRQAAASSASRPALVSNTNKRPTSNYWSPSSWSDNSAAPSQQPNHLNYQQQQQQQQQQHQQQRQQVRSTSQQLARPHDLQESLNYRCPPIYPISMLNPIPECGETNTLLAANQRPRPPKPMPKPARPLPVAAESAPRHRFAQGLAGKLANSRGPPNNHYLINDVQYARISRNS